MHHDKNQWEIQCIHLTLCPTEFCHDTSHYLWRLFSDRQMGQCSDWRPVRQVIKAGLRLGVRWAGT